MRLKKEWIRIVREFLVTQMNHWVLFTPAATIMGLAISDKPVLWRWCLCSLLPFFFYFVRIRTNHFLSFLFAHLLPAAGMFLVPCQNPVEMWLLRVLAVGYMLRSFHIRFRGEKQQEEGIFPMVGVILVAACLWIMAAHGPEGWETYFIMPLILFLALHFIKFYLEHFMEFLSVNGSSTGYIPRNEIFHSGLKLILLFTLTGALILGALSNTSWMSGLGAYLKRLVIWLLRKLFAGRGVEEEPEEILPQEVPSEPLNPFAGAEVTEPALFWVILQKIVVFLFTCAVVVGLVMAARYLIRVLIERFHRKPAAEEEENEDVVDIREKCRIERPKKKKPLFHFLQPRERIRRIFQKKVKAGKNRILEIHKRSRLECLTSGECAEGLDQQLLAVIYDKARYSEEECTLEDVAAMKEEG